MDRRILRALGAALMLGFATFCFAVPQVLIVQRHVEKSRAGDPNQDIGDFVAQRLQDSGKLDPTYWSNTDTGFRAMIADKKVENATPPSLEAALIFAAQQKFDYVLMVECVAGKDGGAYLARADLYKGGNRIWSDPPDPAKFDSEIEATLMTAAPLSQTDFDKLVAANGCSKLLVKTGAKIDIDNTLLSIANTWAQQIASGPLSGLSTQPYVPSPSVLPGPVARLEQTAPVIPKPADNSKLFADVETMIRDGHSRQAVMVLHDGIDAQPFDFERRARLVKLLNSVGHPELAAAEAARAALLDPGSSGFRLESARALLTLGNLDGADSMAKDALARNPKDGDAHLIQGIVSLRRGNATEALSHFDAALAGVQSGEGLFYRAFAEAFVGDAQRATNDLAASGSATPSFQPDYSGVTQILDAGVAKLGDEIRNILPSASVSNPPADTADSVKRATDAAVAVAAFISKLNVPSIHAGSHQRRLLALKLLAQGCGELAACLKQYSEDALNDARIDLGEAMKQYQSAKEAYAGESTQ